MSETTAKRYRRRTAKPGQVLVYYGKIPGDEPDIVYAWGAGGASKRHGNLLAWLFGGQRVRIVYGEERAQNGGSPYVFDKTMLEELDAAGFDLTTLNFSIQMKSDERLLTGSS
jgi:hypothetical protein